MVTQPEPASLNPEQTSIKRDNMSSDDTFQSRPDKSKLSLDFGSTTPKKQNGDAQNNNPCFLDSPDMQMLKVNSPELEKMIMANYTFVQPSGNSSAAKPVSNSAASTSAIVISTVQPQSSVVSSKYTQALSIETGTTAPPQGQEYRILSVPVPIVPSKGRTDIKAPVFSDASRPSVSIQSIDSLPSSSSKPVSLGQTIIAPPVPPSVNASLPTVIRLEPSTSSVPPTGSIQPAIAIKSEPLQCSSDESSSTTYVEIPDEFGVLTRYPQLQDQIKQERKRLRNRIAATKCRRRKLEKISTLEDQVKELKRSNSDLNQRKYHLKEQVALLKQKVMTHLKNGCQVHVGANVPNLN